MSTSPRGYEFTQQQNSLIGDLSYRMRGVGAFLVFIAVLNFLLSALVVVAIYRARLPQNYLDALDPDVKAKLSSLPPDNHLWGIAISSAVNGFIYLLVGVWTKAAADSFKQIVDTTGSDINHLMNAISSLHKMYTLVYTLIVIGLLLSLTAAGFFFYAQFTR
jgi:hypothetical protein